ncbi:hypothetical protein [Rhodovibrio sodomensis]|uniref:hypothetical protein n=1 Tax=Rhodovibrio sodomensis TaxID=1088 RepID=UPI001909033D|nr:hypothetical protein [Rhodovibrio sodomensis]
MADIVQLTAFRTRYSSVSTGPDGIRFPQLYRSDCDLDRVHDPRIRVHLPESGPVIHHTLEPYPDPIAEAFDFAEALSFTPIDALSPELDPVSLVYRHHRSIEQRDAYLSALLDRGVDDVDYRAFSVDGELFSLLSGHNPPDDMPAYTLSFMAEVWKIDPLVGPGWQPWQYHVAPSGKVLFSS